LFWFGVFLLLLGGFGVYSGIAWARGGPVDREKDPKGFWSIIAMDYLGGIGLIVYYFYKVNGFPN
jgi:uncharacterized membrane protein